jgi:aminomethyltransferase
MFSRAQTKFITSKTLQRGFAEDLKKTALYNYHIEKLNVSKMVPFAGYAMPVFYNNYGVKTEHDTCRQYAAIFDVSHMG